MECSKQVILEYSTTFTCFSEVDEVKHLMLCFYTILNWLYVKKGKQMIIFYFNCVMHSPRHFGNQGCKVRHLYGYVTKMNQKLRIHSLYLIYYWPDVQKCHWLVIGIDAIMARSAKYTEKGEWKEEQVQHVIHVLQGSERRENIPSFNTANCIRPTCNWW